MRRPESGKGVILFLALDWVVLYYFNCTNLYKIRSLNNI